MGKQEQQSLRDVARAPKVERKVQHLRDMEFEVEAPQRLMRAEMEAGVHKIGAVLEETFGPAPSEVTDMAIGIIHNSELTLTMAQWIVVQQMVEDGIRAGIGYQD